MKATLRFLCSLLPAEQAQLLQLVFVGEMLQPSDHLCPPQDPLQKLHIFPKLEASDIDTMLHNRASRAQPFLLPIMPVKNMAANDIVKKYLAGYRKHFEKKHIFPSNQLTIQPTDQNKKQKDKNPKFY